MNKRPLILFSGGWESTILVKRAFETDEGCDILTIDHSFNLPSAENEADARQAIMDKLVKDHGCCKIYDHQTIRDHYDTDKFPRNTTFGQLYGLIHYLFCSVDPARHSSAQIGYCLTDDTATLHYKLIELWAMMFAVYRFGQELVPLDLPLLRVPKYLVREELGDYEELTWSCNFPIYKDGNAEQCGKCVSCTDNRHAIEMQQANSYVKDGTAFKQTYKIQTTTNDLPKDTGPKT